MHNTQATWSHFPIIMHKKIVHFDGWHFTEVDPVRLRRKAIALRDQIAQKIEPDNDPYNFYGLTVPVVEAALRGDITQALDDNKQKFISANYMHDKREGFLATNYDSEFNRAVAGFAVTALALPLDELVLKTIDGVTFAEMELEDEGDWPDKVKYP